MKTKPYLTSLLAGGILLLASCVHEPENPPTVPEPTMPSGVGIPCDPDTVYFGTSIMPLLTSNCAIPGCHDANTMQDGIDLSSYAGVMGSGVVNVNNPWSSDMLEAITDNDPEDKMPPAPNTPLTQEQIDMIYTWMAQGAKNNSCQAACDTNVFTFSGSVQPIIQTRCQGCHSGGSPQGGILLTSYDQIKTVALSGQLLGAVSFQSGYTPMPYGGNKIPECEIVQIKKWIQDGTPNN